MADYKSCAWYQNGTCIRYDKSGAPISCEDCDDYECRTVVKVEDIGVNKMLKKRNCMNFDEESGRCAFGSNCTLNCPDFENSNEMDETMNYKKIEITLKSGETITYSEGKWDDYAYDGKAVIVKHCGACVGIYNFDDVYCVELKG